MDDRPNDQAHLPPEAKAVARNERNEAVCGRVQRIVRAQLGRIGCRAWAITPIIAR